MLSSSRNMSARLVVWALVAINIALPLSYFFSRWRNEAETQSVLNLLGRNPDLTNQHSYFRRKEKSPYVDLLEYTPVLDESGIGETEVSTTSRRLKSAKSAKLPKMSGSAKSSKAPTTAKSGKSSKSSKAPKSSKGKAPDSGPLLVFALHDPLSSSNLYVVCFVSV